ncbi:MraY family glycosyltransferase [Inquilinus sp. Marseille-Q2685]|uniref:MraY family glycosyltransferase n=1 Tax=Inquilinus sp. Marseille-Q2685 TaxID=2866581 RepID=UPI001CE45128|nr:MraY family glycosyltransferase [Inquilinus sp. Marseille-Q2685]
MPDLTPHLLNGFLLAVVLVAWMQRIAPRLGLVDRPSERKRHEGIVPRCGGLAMFAAYGIGLLLFDRTLQGPWVFVGGLAVIVAAGAADDRLDLRPLIRLLAQTFAAIAIIVLGQHRIADLGASTPGLASALGEPLLSAVCLVMTIVFLVGLTNAFNMIDGLDGLAGGTAAAALFWLALLASFIGRQELVAEIALLLAAVLGFLVFNTRHRWRPRALVFMGDAGSTMLGAAIGYFIIDLSSGPQPTIPFPVLLWVCIIPVVDTLSLIVRRLLAGRSPFSPDRWHLHHLLLDLGVPHALSAMIIIGVSILLGAVAYLGSVLLIPDSVLTIGLLAPVATQLGFVWMASRRDRVPAAGQLAPEPRR